jgi:hypothetical protein
MLEGRRTILAILYNMQQVCCIFIVIGNEVWYVQKDAMPPTGKPQLCSLYGYAVNYCCATESSTFPSQQNTV